VTIEDVCQGEPTARGSQRICQIIIEEVVLRTQMPSSM